MTGQTLLRCWWLPVRTPTISKEFFSYVGGKKSIYRLQDIKIFTSNATALRSIKIEDRSERKLRNRDTGDHRTAVPQKLYGSQAVKCRKDYYVCMKPSRGKEFACKSVINQIARLLVDLRSIKSDNKYYYDPVTKQK